MTKLHKFAGLLALTLVGSLHAAPVLVTSAAGLGATDSVNWGQLGADGTDVAPNFTATSLGGRAITGSLSGIGCNTVVVGNVCGWDAGTGFASGDHLIWAEDPNGAPSGPLTLNFAAIRGAGLFVQANPFSAFTATIEVFGSAGSLGSFNEVSNANGDGLFIGVLDSVADITSITVSVTGNDFAVNSLLINPGLVSSVPEPSTLTLLLAPLGLALFRRRKAGAANVTKGESA
jgi:hypothetical protein